MNITIKKSNGENEKTRTIWFPIEEENPYKICSELGIEMTQNQIVILKIVWIETF